jgi:hypothetical protein
MADFYSQEEMTKRYNEHILKIANDDKATPSAGYSSNQHYRKFIKNETKRDAEEKTREAEKASKKAEIDKANAEFAAEQQSLAANIAPPRPFLVRKIRS